MLLKWETAPYQTNANAQIADVGRTRYYINRHSKVSSNPFTLLVNGAFKGYFESMESAKEFAQCLADLNKP